MARAALACVLFLALASVCVGRRVARVQADGEAASACSRAGAVLDAFQTAMKGSIMLKKTTSKGKDADDANALQAELEAFATQSGQEVCDVSKMTWGKKKKYWLPAKGFTKAANLVAEITKCCADDTDEGDDDILDEIAVEEKVEEILPDVVEDEIQENLVEGGFAPAPCAELEGIVAAFREASQGTVMLKKTTSKGLAADAANAFQARLAAFAKSTEGNGKEGCEVSKMTWGKAKYNTEKGFTKAEKLVGQIIECCADQAEAETPSSPKDESVIEPQADLKVGAEIAEEPVDLVPEELEEVETPGCSNLGNIKAAFKTASTGTIMLKKTTSKGKDADAANAFQNELQKFAKAAKGGLCQVARMKYGKGDYYNELKGYTKSVKLVENIEACCS